MRGNIVYIMGVSGSGKTTVGKLLAQEYGCSFYDGDAFHSPENVKKMSLGIPLTDADRSTWLDSINDFVKKTIRSDNLIFACSALKESYRTILSRDIPEDKIKWIWLKCDYKTIFDRMKSREHFMPPSLLKSQFEVLEPPIASIEVNMDASVEEIILQLKDKKLW